MFKNIFNRGKKKEAEVNLTVRGLQQGYLFDYDLSTWEVKAVYEYDWGSENFSKEYLVSDGRQKRFLSVEEDDTLSLLWSEKVKVRSILKDLPNRIVEDNNPPESIAYNGMQFYLEEESPGYFKDLGDDHDEWEELIAWDYEDEEGNYNLTIERWGERDFEASYGKYIDEFEISSILPRE